MKLRKLMGLIVLQFIVESFSNVEAHACDNFDYQCSLVLEWLYVATFWILNKDSKMWTLPLFQYNYQGQYFNDYGPSFASYIVGIVTITIVYLIFQKHIISGMSNGAVK